jgi:ABC-type nitrate/sulfonate/bicarbonate transport system substrate-binding protein
MLCRTSSKVVRSGVAGSLAAAVLVGVLGSVPAASAASSTNVTIAGSFNADYGLIDIAQSAGFFKAQGLNVKLTNTAGVSAANLQAAFESGAYTFEAAAAPAEILAAAAGGDFQAVFGLDIGQQAQLTIAGDVAAKDHIPTAGATPAQTKAQVAAIKGHHLTLGISNTSSNSYSYGAAIFKGAGISYSPATAQAQASSSASVSFDSLGTTSTFVPAMAAGKIDGFILPPPVSNVKGSVIVNLGNLEPVHSSAGLYLTALTKTIKGEPATVQKVVNAMVQAWNFAKENPAKAEPMLQPVYTANGISAVTDSLAHLIFNDDAKYWVTPMMPASAYQGTVGIIETAQATPVKLTFGQFVDNTFVNQAVKTTKVKLPTVG